jgi:CPA2 family monovalent cation:H+ antiporter-2
MRLLTENHVIIAGFGHFGSTVGRLLRANKINATYLDLIQIGLRY